MRGALWIVAGLVGAAGAGAAQVRESPVPLGLDIYMPVPDDNLPTPEKIALGRRLFFDVRLSATGAMSCASCHDPAKTFGNGQRVGVGVFGRTGTRNVPTIINRGYGVAFFWDGRAATLEDQVLGPIENPAELGSRVSDAVRLLRNDASSLGAFQSVFDSEPSKETLARALASYVRSIVAGDAPIDRYLAGDREAILPEAREGLRIFRGKGNCMACHVGPTFTDERFHNTGVAWVGGTLRDDGRAGVSGRPEDGGAFKTPTLRHVAQTGPYMHDGSIDTLDEVVDFYDRGGIPNHYLDPELRPLGLSPFEKRNLVAFLTSLSGRIVERRW